MKALQGMKRISVKKQSGFTLIEIAIVLVIIGLLLGGVLQGQQLIENSRVKNAINDLNGIAAATFSYRDRYGRLPGDDNAGSTTGTVIQARGDSWATVVLGDSDGSIDAALADVFLGTAAGESGDFFQHLRAAGFIGGDSALIAADALPSNAFGGITGITTDATVLGAMGGTKLCMSNVSGASAGAMDTQLDDGSPDSGRFRASASTTNVAPPSATAATVYDEDLTYAVCSRM